MFQHFREWLTRRRLTACVLLVTSLLMVFPISMPVAMLDVGEEPSGKDLSAPFPCQSRRCGCKSAKQCWKKCCCFTDTQKVAWAKANRVKVPAFVAAAAQRESSVAPGTCKVAETCCATEARPLNRPRVQLVVGIEALQCQGAEQTISGLLVSVQPPEIQTVVISNPGTGEFMPLRDLPLAPSEQEPPTPPPRLSVA